MIQTEKTSTEPFTTNIYISYYEQRVSAPFADTHIRSPSFIPFKSEQSLEPSTDFVQLFSRCAHVSSKALWATARCNGNTDGGKRIKAVRKHANNNKSKQMRYNDQLGFNI